MYNYNQLNTSLYFSKLYFIYVVYAILVRPKIGNCLVVWITDVLTGLTKACQQYVFVLFNAQFEKKSQLHASK